jgi:hypothetical protein
MSRFSFVLWTKPRIVGVLIGAAVGAAHIALYNGDMSVPVGAAVGIQALPHPSQPRGTAALPVISPSVDESDAVVRDFVRQVSAHPRSSAWLVPDSLIRTFVAAWTPLTAGRR